MTFGVCAPNHCTPSWTMRHWKLVFPVFNGAVTWNVSVTDSPGNTVRGIYTRLNPHVVLSCGFCEPSLYVDPACQSVFPVFFIVIETVNGSAAVTNPGTCCEMNCAELLGVTTVIDTLFVASPKRCTPSCNMRHWKL